MILGAVVLAASLGLAAAARALPPHITVTAPTRMDIIRGGQVSGKMSLPVGTTLDVDGVSGEFVLVRIRLLKGRVPARDTDISVLDPGGQYEAQTTPSPAPAPAAKAAAPTATAAKPASPTPVPLATARAAVPLAPAPPRPPLDRRPPRLGTAPLVVMWAGILITIVSAWRVFAKAGKPGWASIVPIYNLVVWQQIAGKPLWWIALYFVPFVNLVVAVLCGFALARNFGKGKAFGLGLVLLPWIFIPVLAFGDDVYLGTAG
jgi:hypothetical protein